LIVADNGSDMYITGTFDTRWDNDILHPAFALLTASDFDVIHLGWQPGPSGPPALASVSANPSTVTGGNSATGTVTLTAPAPAGGVLLTLQGSNPAIATPPSSVTIPAATTSVTFLITTVKPSKNTTVTFTASYAGGAQTATLTVKRR